MTGAFTEKIEGSKRSVTSPELLDDEDQTSTSSYDDDTTETDYDHEDDEIDKIPMFKYARLLSSLPCDKNRMSDSDSNNIGSNEDGNDLILCPACHTTTIGKGACSPLSSYYSLDSTSANKSNAFGANSIMGLSSTTNSNVEHSPMSMEHFPVMALGLRNGDVHLIDVQTGLSLQRRDNALLISSSSSASGVYCSPNYYTIPKNYAKETVTCMSFDSSGNFLAACRGNNDVAIFGLKYEYSEFLLESFMKEKNASDKNYSGAESTASTTSNVFSSFFGMSTTNSSENTSSGSNDTLEGNKSRGNQGRKTFKRSLEAICGDSSITTRFSYTSAPQCVALDPAYNRKRDKQMVVGFRDGRVVLTKVPSFFNAAFKRVTNIELYNQGLVTGNSSSTSSLDLGIENLVWRGALLAWADSTGIKLFDVDKKHRIARIDRPAGARPSLYPSIGSIKPHLCFERSDSLIIAWGDCIMTMEIDMKQKKIQRQQSDDSSTASSQKPICQVKCSMAWELDCVTCGVAPIDENHIAVLGLVPPSSDDDSEDEDEGGNEANGEQNRKEQQEDPSANTLELQIFSRNDGSVKITDVLPLRNLGTSTTDAIGSASEYMLSSSFALPKMDDDIELEEEELLQPDLPSARNENQAVDSIMNPLGSIGGVMASSMNFSSASASKEYVDLHLKWTLPTQDITSLDHPDEDDLSFLFCDSSSSTESFNKHRKSNNPLAPSMVITSLYDAVLVRVRSEDDVISHYRSFDYHGYALKHAIEHLPLLRKYSSKQNFHTIINEYLVSLISSEDKIHMAARMTPALLGCETNMWERWLCQFIKVDGGLFCLRPFLPVRDPILSPQMYEMALHKMLIEVQSICESSHQKRIQTSKQIFIDTLRGWGPVGALKEFYLLLNYHDVQDNFMKKQVEVDLFMRAHQTSSYYLSKEALILPIQRFEEWKKKSDIKSDMKSKVSGNSDMLNKLTSIAPSKSIKDEDDSLYNVNSFTLSVMERLPIHDESSSQAAMSIDTCILLLESAAALHCLGRNYQESLKMYLLVGSLLNSVFVGQRIEDLALESVSSAKVSDTAPSTLYPYDYVLAILEYHNLHCFLLDDSFLPRLNRKSLKSSTKEKQWTFRRNRNTEASPIICLIQLVGLEQAGKFLIKNSCFPSFSSTTDNNQSSYLPITLVAEQLQGQPRFLLWYLNMLLFRRPELYVNFPNTSIPPPFITDLHRRHLDFYIEYVSKLPENIEEENNKESTLMVFLKVSSSM